MNLWLLSHRELIEEFELNPQELSKNLRVFFYSWLTYLYLLFNTHEFFARQGHLSLTKPEP